jgi:hypothetical protein
LLPDKYFLKGTPADDAEREHWRNLRIYVFSHLIIDAINRKSVGTRVFIIGVMPHVIFPSILKEAQSMAIDHFKEQGIEDVSLISSLFFLLTFVQSYMKLNREKQDAPIHRW